jgi:uncharacterized protein YciI
MRYFAVIREPGPRWDFRKPMREQADWGAHAEFMDALAEEGFVVLDGPLGHGSKFLLAFDALSEAEIRQRLEQDPWTKMDLLRITSVEPWESSCARSARGSARVQPHPSRGAPTLS